MSYPSLLAHRAATRRLLPELTYTPCATCRHFIAPVNMVKMIERGTYTSFVEQELVRPNQMTAFLTETLTTGKILAVPWWEGSGVFETLAIHVCLSP